MDPQSDSTILVLALLACRGFHHEALQASSLSRSLRTDPLLWDALKSFTPGPRGKTLLMHACYRGDLERAQFLLARGAPVDAECTYSFPWHMGSALQFAMACPSLPLVTLLLASGASPTLARKDDRSTPLHIAAALGHPAILAALLASSPPSAVHALDEDGGTPLHRAAFSGHTEAAAALLAAGAQVSATRRSDGSTALLLACASQRKGSAEELVRCLIRAGARLNQARRFDGLFPVLACCETGRLAALAALLGAGAAPNQPGPEEEETAALSGGGGGGGSSSSSAAEAAAAAHYSGFTKSPLMAAAQRGSNELIHLLVSYGACVNTAQSGSLKTALHLAAERGHCSTVQLLVEQYGAELEARTREGWSALFFAARMGQLQTVKALKALGACTSGLDADRDSAREVAASHGHHAVVKELSG